MSTQRPPFARISNSAARFSRTMAIEPVMRRPPGRPSAGRLSSMRFTSARRRFKSSFGTGVACSIRELIPPAQIWLEFESPPRADTEVRFSSVGAGGGDDAPSASAASLRGARPIRGPVPVAAARPRQRPRQRNRKDEVARSRVARAPHDPPDALLLTRMLQSPHK